MRDISFRPRIGERVVVGAEESSCSIFRFDVFIIHNQSAVKFNFSDAEHVLSVGVGV